MLTSYSTNSQFLGTFFEADKWSKELRSAECRDSAGTGGGGTWRLEEQNYLTDELDDDYQWGGDEEGL